MMTVNRRVGFVLNAWTTGIRKSGSRNDPPKRLSMDPDCLRASVDFGHRGNSGVVELNNERFMMSDLLPPEHAEIAEVLLPYALEFAQQHDGLVKPDRETQQIILRCIGMSFSLGVAYGQTDASRPWQKRIHEAFDLIRNGSVK